MPLNEGIILLIFAAATAIFSMSSNSNLVNLLLCKSLPFLKKLGMVFSNASFSSLVSIFTPFFNCFINVFAATPISIFAWLAESLKTGITNSFLTLSFANLNSFIFSPKLNPAFLDV